MANAVVPFEDPDDGREEIFRATYEVLKEHGYADLSIGRIAEETDRSKSTIYHHFDDKDDLVVAFSERLVEFYLEELVMQPRENVIETLDSTFDLIVFGQNDRGEQLEDIMDPALSTCFHELRLRAIHDDGVRAQTTAMDEQVRSQLATLLAVGKERGEIRADVDPEQTAAFLYVIVEGALILRSTTDAEGWLPHLRDSVDEVIADLSAESEPAG